MSNEDVSCPDCSGNLVFMEEKKKFWCPACSGTKIPTMHFEMEDGNLSGRKERLMHGYFDEVKLKDANPLAFYGTIALVIAATLVLFWFSYMHNPLGIPQSYQGNDVYPGFGNFDSMLGYIGWIVMLAGLVVIGALLWFRDPASCTSEAEKSHKFFRYGVVASLTGMGVFSLSSVMRNQVVEAKANLGLEAPSYFIIAFVFGIILVLCGVVLFVMSHRVMKDSDFRDSRSLYFEDIGLTVTGDCPECGFATELMADDCDNCSALLMPVDFSSIREDMLQDRKMLEEPLDDDTEPTILSLDAPKRKGKLPEMDDDVEPEYEVVEEIIEEELIESMDTFETLEAEDEAIADELVEQTVLDELAEPTAELAHACDSCGKSLTFIEQYDAWYCYDCEKYEGE
ncbi:MAG TPA: hypothetical protein ENN76_00620 [Euryarchaeota archaeon]|nr:hypothetical protein [Euryarchaeota archaeon]